MTAVPMMFQAYGVVEDAGDKNRLYLGHFLSESAARMKVRDAIASGCMYGYVKQGHDVIVYLTVESFVVKGLIEKAEADYARANGGKRIRAEPFLRIE